MLFRTRTLTSVGAALGSAMCWDREQVMLAVLAPGPQTPLDLFSAARNPAQLWTLGRSWGQSYVSSVRLYLEEWGKAQNKTVAVQAGGD